MATEKLFSEKTTDFALNLFREETKVNTNSPKCENSFLSPTSIVVALAMAQKGASGETKKQMFQGLFGSQLDEQTADKKLSELCKFLTQKENTPGYTLNSANRLFCDEKYPFHKQYLQQVKQIFNADLENVDFANDSRKSVQKINDWVKDETHGKIAKLFESLSSDVKMVITNAIYFKGDWKKQFKEESTREEDFHVSENLTNKLQFMHTNARFDFSMNEKVALLSMPYVNENLSMVFILPNQRFGLAAMEKELTGEKLWEWIDEMGNCTIQVSIPKFRLESSMGLVETLKHLGMTDMFSHGADFSKMSSMGKDLSVSDVVHKAFLEINEKGSEAAATTGIAMAQRSMPMRFVANQPFLFSIVEKSTKSLLFLGHFYGH